MKTIIPELLAPAGSYDALKAAIYAGCDAVYLSGEKFGARANADNFTNEKLSSAIDFAHLYGVKVYYAANTLVKENEIQIFLEQARFLYREGVDALIIQDIGIYNILKRYLPLFPLHASTQMTVHSLKGVTELQTLGFDRVVLSRELTIEEIKNIITNSEIEIECFVHGALCFSYSGQCLMSSLIGGRSGNRGTCAQPCRLPYDIYEKNRLNSQKQKFLLSPKDIQTLEILPTLIKSGIHSFKIEGRMKSANYVGLITSLYRKYINLYMNNPKNYHVDKTDLRNMQQIYNRGGFSTGYYFKKNGKDMMSYERPNHQGIVIGKVAKIINPNNLILDLYKKVNQGDCIEIYNKDNNYSFTIQENILKPTYKLYVKNHNFKVNDLVLRLTDVALNQIIQEKILKNTRKLKLELLFKAKISEKMCLSISYKSLTVNVLGPVVERAITSSITPDKIITQLSKTAHDDLIVERVNMDVDEQIFISIKALNNLRRTGINKLINTITGPFKRDDIKIKYNVDKNVNPLINNKLNVLVRTIEQFNTVIKYEIDTIYLEISCFETEDILIMARKCHKGNIKLYIALPRIIRDKYVPLIKAQLKRLNNSYVTGVMIRSLDGYAFVKDDWSFIVDYSVHIFNNEAINFWEEKGAEKIGVSVELNQAEINKLKTSNLEILVYGYIPLMITTQCVYKNLNNTCTKGEALTLKDRKNMNFEVYRDCQFCYNTIYNTHPIVLLDKYQELNKAGIYQFRIDLLNESGNVIEQIMNYAIKLKNKESFSSDEYKKTIFLNHFTRGHFFRGVK